MSTIIEKQRAIIVRENLDAMVAISPESVAYTAGFYVPSQLNHRQRHAMCVITANGPDTMTCVDIEASYVRSRSPFADVRQYQEFKEKPMDLLADVLQEYGLARGRVAIELDYLPARDFAYLVDRLPGVTWVDAEDLYWELRMIKTPEEIAVLKEMGKIAERTHHIAFGKLHAGMTEKDLEKIVIDELYSAGADRILKIIIGSGERSSFPNCPATDRVIRDGDLIRMDILAFKNNYLSDCARTAVVGSPNDEQKAYWQKMVDTRKATLEMVKPGVHTDEIYKVYCLKFEGFGLPLTNFLGHGLGLTSHEYPYIGIHGGAVLEENMVLCVEPVWVSAEVGVGFQLEDEIVITKDGYELITDYAPTDHLIEVH